MTKLILNLIFLMRGIASSLSQSSNGNCFCVPNNTCNLVEGPTDGSGQIDPRIMTSGSYTSPITGANNETNTPITTGINLVLATPQSCTNGLQLCCPSKGFSCGMVFPPVANSPTPIAAQGQTQFGAFPWQAAMLTNDNSYIGSGALIDQLHVLTAAHKIQDIATSIKIRLGDWDAASDNEPLPAVEIQSSLIFIHPNYNERSLQYDIAIIRLSSAAPLGVMPSITNICLPSSPISGIRCWVSGWGKNDFVPGGQYSAIMKAIDVPLVDYNSCLKQLRTTRLGQNFLLDPVSFTCAGGEVAKDACTGDGGAPLSCSVGGKWYLTGLVSWGIGCGQTNIPGVYVNIFNLTKWIQETTQTVRSGIVTTTKQAAKLDAETSATQSTVKIGTTVKVSQTSSIVSTDAASQRTSTKTNSGTRSGTNSGTRSGTNSGTRSGTNSGTRSGANSGTRSGTNSGTRSGTNSGTRSGTNSGTRTTSTTKEKAIETNSSSSKIQDTTQSRTATTSKQMQKNEGLSTYSAGMTFKAISNTPKSDD